MAKTLYLTFDLEEWPWPYTVTTRTALWDAPVHQISNVYRIKCYGQSESGLFDRYIWPLTLKDDLDLDILPLKMCDFVKYTFFPNIKSLSVFAQKLWPMLKLFGQNSIFDLWPLRMTLTFHFYHSKCAYLWDAHVH